jgi:Domain of unknown function (DUF1992)
MTERKPREISFTSWIDQQISEAEERGAFDDLPGAGKPLPRRTEDAGQAWLRDYLRREGVPAEDLLPTPLRLRKQVQRLTETVQDIRSEAEVREIVAELNRQITEWRRIPAGPPVFLPLVGTEAMVASWRDGRPKPAAAADADRTAGAGGAGTRGSGTARAGRFPRPRWWHRG